MKTIKYITSIIFIAIFLGCNETPKTEMPTVTEPTEKIVEDEEQATATKKDNSKYYATSDIVKISTETRGIIVYKKDVFNQIVDEQPEFFEDEWIDPDKKYNCFGERNFGSEVGQDEYFILYAYFLKQKNGGEKYAAIRKRLIDIYIDINSLFQRLRYGGTYFGHQEARILGYAEYSIYLYADQVGELKKTYNIEKQKELYIKSLRQLIEDESSIDNEVSGEAKTSRNNELNEIVDELDKLIINIFYLRRAQEFHYSRYE